MGDWKPYGPMLCRRPTAESGLVGKAYADVWETHAGWSWRAERMLDPDQSDGYVSGRFGNRATKAEAVEAADDAMREFGLLADVERSASSGTGAT
jgi:hypothetical protein